MQLSGLRLIPETPVPELLSRPGPQLLPAGSTWRDGGDGERLRAEGLPVRAQRPGRQGLDLCPPPLLILTAPVQLHKNPTATIEHEATTSKISEDQLFYAMSRGLDQEAAVALIVNGFAREVLKQLPMEFAVEAQKLLGISLEGSVG